ncbi:MAG TPA: DNA-directed RNA polymerase subunit beta, partial [Chthoniobacterales bacterium]|nr:DNA-directed RNA polymerase subunit beta [Chthoniobacterales bacterium]
MPHSKATERINFGKIKEIIAPPNLIELQTNSYKEFLQAEIPQSKRKNLGLQAVFTEVFPIESYDGKCVLDFHSYEIGEPKVDWLECLREGLTYGAPLYVTFLLKEEKGTKEEKVFMGELPLMTPQGTFVINGAERVIVSQLHRSPGLAFEATQHPNGKTLHSFRIIPDRGSWYEAQFDTSDLLYVYLDRKKRRRKFLTTTFFRALSFLESEGKGKDSDKDKDKTRGTDEEILKLFYEIEEMSVKEAEKREDLPNKVLIEDAMDEEKGLVVARAFEPLSKAVVKQIAELGINKIKVVDTTLDEGIVIKCMKKDPAKNEEEALKDIYRRLRPGDPPTAANARALIKRLFFDPKRYDLGRVGRYKINQKLGIKGGDSRILTKADLVAATKYLLRLKKGEGSLDDIDHLGSRRVRTVGELLANQCRVGLARTERLVKERMTLFDQGVEQMTPQKLINPKALSAVIRDFFGRSQLSQ